jgi:hypothetical protein
MNLDRTCIKCKQPFQIIPKPYLKPTNICYQCKREYQRKYENKKSKVLTDGKKELYPIADYEKRARFKRIQKELSEIRDRKEWQAYLKDKLDNLDPAILKWIYDRRDHESLADERDKRNFKRDEYEDTRTSHNNQSWFD